MMRSANCLWLEWDVVTTDAARLPISKDQPVLYFLSMRPGFHAFVQDQRVHIKYGAKKKSQLQQITDEAASTVQGSRDSGGLSLVGTGSVVSANTTTVDSMVPAPAIPHDEGEWLNPAQWFPGKIRKVHIDRHQGLYDVVYDDGAREYRVPRHRIRPTEPAAWQLLYVGTDNHYSAEGLVPDYSLYKDTDECDTSVAPTFALQTQFTEYSWDPEKLAPFLGDELSMKSPTVTYRTRRVTEEERRASHLGRKFKEAIEMAHGVTMQITSGTSFEAGGGLESEYV